MKRIARNVVEYVKGSIVEYRIIRMRLVPDQPADGYIEALNTIKDRPLYPFESQTF